MLLDITRVFLIENQHIKEVQKSSKPCKKIFFFFYQKLTTWAQYLLCIKR